MTALAAETASPVGRQWPGRFKVEFVTEDGVGRRVALADALALPFERFRPVRRGRRLGWPGYHPQARRRDRALDEIRQLALPAGRT